MNIVIFLFRAFPIFLIHILLFLMGKSYIFVNLFLIILFFSTLQLIKLFPPLTH